ncbi:MAG: CoB--CoM heterodisulfide reductase iron-sulfur subunit B family protein [Desulfobulbaceae bacterium]|jgi:heterodisulfide reductase subunit B|nr:CoB--CoM heterodisulfide reductase iron-sulfur subunit B family protein [Desulfobulbaceae bacterium]
MEKIGLYLGCNIPLKAPDVEQSFRKVFPVLGIEPVDLPGATCCPAWGTAPSFDRDTWCAISARNITIAEGLGVDIMTGCNSCFGIMSEAKHFLHDKATTERVNARLAEIGRKYQGTSDIYHVMHVLHDKVGCEKIRENLKYSLDGLTIAVQTGCHTLWPSDVYSTCEANPFYPVMLKELCEATGAAAPHYSRLESCCGMGGMRSTDAEKSLVIFRDKLMSMQEEIKPDIIVTACSSCYMQFDMSQPILKERGLIDFEPIPTLYYTQLLALAMGFDSSQVAAISQIDRSAIIKEIQSEKRLMKEVA